VILESISVGLIVGSCISFIKSFSFSSSSLSLELLSIFEQMRLGVPIVAGEKEVWLLPTINKEIVYPWGHRFLINLPVGKSSRDVIMAKQALSEALRKDVEIKFDNGLILDIFNEKLPEMAPYHYAHRQDWKVPLGINQRKDVHYFDFDAPYPNFLDGGLPGSGKSCVARVMLTSLIKNKHDHLQLFLVDLKAGIEFMLFKDLQCVKGFAITLNELFHCVTTVEGVMEDRLSQMYTRNMRKWNGDRCVIFIDELSDLIETDHDPHKKLKQQIKAKLRAISAKGRAAGCWVCLSTQRPTVNSVPGDIRTNISTAIAFRTRDEIQSRTILDAPDAAYLPDIPGRAIYQHGHKQEIIQCFYLDDTDAEKLLEDVPRKVVEHGDNEPKPDTGIEPSIEQKSAKGKKVGKRSIVLK